MIGGRAGRVGGGGGSGASMTPMIDVVFLLIIFFMLVAQISRQRVVELDLPRLADSVSDVIEGDSRLLVNVVPEAQADRLGGDYRLGSVGYWGSPDGLAALAEALREAVGRDPEALVLVRAARTETYARVHPALVAVREAGIERVDLVTLREGDR